jgi:hypothetical protein
MHQRPSNVNFYAGALVALAFIASPANADSGSTSEGNPTCVHYRAEAVLGVAGYNHFVYVGNACASTANCSIVTSANPTPIDFTVVPSETLAVITYKESPARIFQVKVQCRLQ